MSNTKARIIVVLILIVPALVIFFASDLLRQVTPDDGKTYPVDALRGGWAYFDCNPPFKQSLSLPNDPEFEAECTIHEGQKQLIVSLKQLPLETDKEIKFEFSPNFNERFQGYSLEVGLNAQCRDCEGTVRFAYFTRLIGNSGWVPLNQDGQGPTTVEYKMPMLKDPSRRISPHFLVDISNLGADDVLTIENLYVRRLIEK